MPNNITIPDTFRKFDTDTTADDAFHNLRDHQVLGQNMNILAARRHRWTLAQITYTGVVGDIPYEINSLAQGFGPRNVVMRHDVEVPLYSPEIHIVAYGSASAAVNVTLYPYFIWKGIPSGLGPRGILIGSSQVFSGGTTAGKVKLTIDIASEARASYRSSGRTRAVIGVFAEMVLDGSDVADDETVLFSGSNFVVTSAVAPGIGVGDYIYVNGRASTTLRRVVSADVVADGSRYVVATIWGTLPEADETLNGQTLVEYIPETITAWCERMTVVP